MADSQNGETSKEVPKETSAEKFMRALSPEQEQRALITQSVWERCLSKCSNCGLQDSKVKLVFIVPEKAGGQFVPSNLTLQCRACEMAAESFNRNPAISQTAPDRRLVNFYMSSTLYERIDRGIGQAQGFDSKGSLFRYLMLKFVEDPERFSDMSMYEDSGEDKIKACIWVAHDTYEAFKEAVFAKDKTVTDALISLVMLYEAESETKISGRKNPHG